MERVATGYGLIEGPVWDPHRGLYFSDVLNGGVFLLDRAGKISTAVPKRRGIGGMALHAAGGLIVGGRDIAWVSLTDGSMKTLLSLDAIPGAWERTIWIQWREERERVTVGDIIASQVRHTTGHIADIESIREMYSL